MKIKLLAITLVLTSAFYPLATLGATKQFQKDTGGTLTTGLQAYYKLEDVNDFWSTNNLTNNGSATFVAGKVNNGASLTPSTQWFEITNLLSSASTQPFTFSGWFRFGVSGSAGTFFYNGAPGFGGGRGQATLFNYTFYKTGTDKIQAYFEQNNVGSPVTINGATTLSINTWYMITVVWNPSGTSVLYINGASDGTATGASAGGASGVQLGIGQIWNGSALVGAYNGLMDEIGMWNKVLSTTEISDLYNGGAGQTMILFTATVCRIRQIGLCH